MNKAQTRFRAPARNGEVLAVPGFAAIPHLISTNRDSLNRADIRVGGLPLRELRALARREVVAAAREYLSDPDACPAANKTDAPLLLTGHQPELSHPGVWVKNFALNGLARKVGGVPINLIVDNDTLKSTSLRLPVFSQGDPRSVHGQSLAFDKLDGEMPYEDRNVIDPELFNSFAARAEPLCQSWGYTSLLPAAWAEIIRNRQASQIGSRFSAVRQGFERAWGCRNLELPVSRLTRSQSFQKFAAHLIEDQSRFRDVYNEALQRYRKENGIRGTNHPAPDLGSNEAPFWVRTGTGSRRERALVPLVANAENLRPRALTLTMFARLCVGDFFIHGIGGGKYDEVTDTIIRDYFGIEPPAYQVLSATLHLPLPVFPGGKEDARRAWRAVRDLKWNPQRHLSDVNKRQEVQRLVAEKAALIENEPEPHDHNARRIWFRDLQQVTEKLRFWVKDAIAAAEALLSLTEAEAEANAMLHRRDYAWVLYPETTLRPFLQWFLEL